MSIGSRIKQLRVHFNLTQKELADKLKISQSNLAKIETDVSKPSFDLLTNIMNIFHIDGHWLLTGEGEMLRSPDTAATPKPALNNLETQIKNLKEKLSILEKQLSDKDRHINDLQDIISLLKQQIEQKDKQLSEKDQQISQLLDAITQKHSDPNTHAAASSQPHSSEIPSPSTKQ